MEKKSENTDLVKQERLKHMSDLATARSFIKDIGGTDRVSDMIYFTFEKLRAMFPHRDEPHKQWTERRIKGWWNRESENVFHWQMLELFEAASKAKEERELLTKARKEYAEFIQKTARIATFLERTDPDFFGAEIERLGRQSRELDRSRD